jgi:hypothetical protein
MNIVKKLLFADVPIKKVQKLFFLFFFGSKSHNEKQI